MISILIASTVVIGWCVLLMWSLAESVECDSLLNRFSAAAFILAVIGLATIIAAASEQEEKGPCLQYETQMYWNAGTKTMMPARICVQRAEWVKP